MNETLVKQLTDSYEFLLHRLGEDHPETIDAKGQLERAKVADEYEELVEAVEALDN